MLARRVQGHKRIVCRYAQLGWLRVCGVNHTSGSASPSVTLSKSVSLSHFNRRDSPNLSCNFSISLLTSPMQSERSSPQPPPPPKKHARVLMVPPKEIQQNISFELFRKKKANPLVTSILLKMRASEEKGSYGDAYSCLLGIRIAWGFENVLANCMGGGGVLVTRVC